MKSDAVEFGCLFCCLRLLGVDHAPAVAGDHFATDGTAGAIGVTRFALKERAATTFLLGLMLWVFLGIHLGGVAFIAKGGGHGVRILQFRRRWGLAEGAAAKQGRCGGGSDELGEEVTA